MTECGFVPIFRGEWSTSIESGGSLNVTWHLGYPHQGGYKIELRDGDDVFLRSLSSDTASEDDAEWISDDTTAQSHQVSGTVVQFKKRCSQGTGRWPTI